MINLFGDEKIRSLGLYQPFATLMLPPFNKIETRWVQAGRKPPFPEGKYLIYSTQKPYSLNGFTEIAGQQAKKGYYFYRSDSTFELRGYALAVGTLYNVRPFVLGDESRTFVTPPEGYNRGASVKHLWCLEFWDVKRIDPFPFKGKQGVGILTEEEKAKIVFL